MDNCINSAQRLALVANAIAVALTENLTASEQNVLGNVVVQIGSTILSIAAATQLCNESKSNSSQKSSDTSSQNSQGAASGNTTQNAKSTPTNNSSKAEKP